MPAVLLDGLHQFGITAAELTVVAVYAIAAAMIIYDAMAGIDDIPLPLVSQLNLAGALIVGISFWYHFVTVSAGNGVEAVMLMITQYTGIVTGIALVFGPLKNRLT